ncbi:hypothetical protein [Lacibacter sp. H407]|uniref:hypothetical protein n=1 Tax=Lacibacter sp. H407 TaxID=3133423 RepID=UPI0030BE0895
MKLILRSVCMIIVSTLLFQLSANAQSSSKTQKAEKALVNYLNTLCKEYLTNEMGIELGTIQQLYTINNGTLSVVRKHANENDQTAIFFVKTSISITEIEDVFFDYYIGFVGINNQSVKEEKSDSPDLRFMNIGTMHLMHIAPVGDGDHGYAVQTKLLKLVADLKKLYKADK